MISATGTTDTKMTQLEVTYKIRNQFDIGFKATNATSSRISEYMLAYTKKTYHEPSEQLFSL